jgi:hypothetical protein
MGPDDDDDTVRLIITEAFLNDSSLQVRETSIASCMVSALVVKGQIEVNIRGWRSSYPPWVVTFLPLSDLLLCNKNILAE